MSVQSMTGFGRSTGQVGPAALVWEVRSVNGKTLDARIRLPQGLDRLEPACRAAVQKRFSRGNIQAGLQIATVDGGSGGLAINERLLAEAIALAKRLESEFGLAPASVDALLGLRGIVEAPDAAARPGQAEDLDAFALALLETALEALAAARRDEGEALRALLGAQVDEIERLTALAQADPARDPAAIKARLAEQVALLMDASSALDPARLAMEAAFLATKADIREELDRLRTHVVSARAMLAAGGPIGRKLDFLAQEFNRESNTLCAKSNAGSITEIGLSLKAVVDQFREQVQNLE